MRRHRLLTCVAALAVALATLGATTVPTFGAAQPAGDSRDTVARAGNGYATDFADERQGWQTITSDWGYYNFPDQCGAPNHGWYLQSRAEWRIKDAPGEYVIVKRVKVTFDVGKLTKIDKVYLRLDGIAGYLLGYKYPGGKRTTHRISFRGTSVSWMASDNVFAELKLNFAPKAHTAYGCRNITFTHELRKGWT